MCDGTRPSHAYTRQDAHVSGHVCGWMQPRRRTVKAIVGLLGLISCRLASRLVPNRGPRSSTSRSARTLTTATTLSPDGPPIIPPILFPCSLLFAHVSRCEPPSRDSVFFIFAREKIETQEMFARGSSSLGHRERGISRRFRCSSLIFARESCDSRRPTTEYARNRYDERASPCTFSRI